ncbi:26S proteasome regulatory complex, subunit PSMD10 [Handroanthus impetiginosus]|uniref:26S proteasome regulatory complex, subunit PSMD10 n=1 Tax=Handroanthus impetiginosus TaxID=429701 RepID=A0A2G9G1J7_9LAMI|nr:26S proteasome regulatory complex, subunit PSMD10 [Handroanthus impetiginosus]
MSEYQCESHQVQIREPAPEAGMEMMNNYARTGDITALYTSIESNPHLLQDMDKIQFIHTPLHEAAAFGQTGFALEILNLMPSFGKKLNPKGLSPLHVALEHKRITTARSLVRMDKQLVRVKGKQGFTPLHLAAKFANADNDDELEMLSDFLLECPESINDLNNRFQTALHVSLEYNCSGSSALILNWITRTSKQFILAWKEVDGNTALHTAVTYGRAKEVKELMWLVELNPKNVNGKTPLDIAEECQTERAKLYLTSAGAQKADERPKVESNGKYLKSTVTFSEHFFRGCYLACKDLALRNDISLVAGLIITATYQAVLQPPGGIYPPEGNSRLATSDALTSHGTDEKKKTVMKMQDYNRFMPANTAAFAVSMAMVLMVLQRQSLFLYLCLMCLAFSYFSALNIISDSSVLTKFTITICLSLIGIACGIKMLIAFVKLVIDQVWLPGLFTVKVKGMIFDRWVGRWLHKYLPLVIKVSRQYRLIKCQN